MFAIASNEIANERNEIVAQSNFNLNGLHLNDRKQSRAAIMQKIKRYILTLVYALYMLVYNQKKLHYCAH